MRALLSIVALLGVQTWATMVRDEMPLFSLVHAAPDGRVLHPAALGQGGALEPLPVTQALRRGPERLGLLHCTKVSTPAGRGVPDGHST
ncbi:MAG TPA: hypothetical protein VE057_28270 [Archangium sp.]|nr:hypothetical protein [Archangium sp.]